MIHIYIWQFMLIRPTFFFFSYCSERALLNRLFLELNKLDSDVLVGHNISGFDLDVLLQRAQVKQNIYFSH